MINKKVFLQILTIIIFFLCLKQLNAQEVLDIGIKEQLSKTMIDFVSPQSSLIDEIKDPFKKTIQEDMLNDGEIIEEVKDNVEDDLIDEKDDSVEEEITDKLVDDDDDEIFLPFFIDELSNYKQSMIEYYRSISDFFGYHIFLQSISEESENNILPSTTNKVIGPGDKIILTLWGDTKLRYTMKVEKSGSIYIPLVQVVHVYGLTLDELDKKMKKVLARHFSTIDPKEGNPTTFYDISYGNLRAVQVLVTGEVNQPGVHSLSTSANVLSALIKAKGVKAEGTLRNIKIIRNGKLFKTVDLYKFLTTGESAEDLNLKDNDNVFVGTRLSTVSLQGEILKPLKFELTENENLSDLITYAGGIAPTARIDKIQIERITPIADRDSSLAFSYLIDIPVYLSKEGSDKILNPYRLYDRDVITIDPIQRILTNYITINGAVFASGRYAYQKNMSIHDIINKSGGLTADAYYERCELIRTKSDKTEQYIRMNLKDNFEMKLMPSDSLNIFSIWDLKSQKVVSIQGFIKNPGYYYLKDSMRVSDLIFTRGGMLDEWRKDRTYTLIAQLTRYNENEITSHIIDININKILQGDKAEDILLENGDRLYIRSKSILNNIGKVSISGHVKNEGVYRLETGMKVEDLIFKANGFKEGAYEEKAIVFRINEKNDNNDHSLEKEVPITKDYFRISDAPKSDFVLKHNDHIIIRRNPYYRYPRKITLSGEVKFPGKYSLTKYNETFSDMIIKAGGLTKEAFIEGTVINRDSLRLVSDFEKIMGSNDKYDLILKEGDKITIPKKPGTVLVEGYVYSPGLLKYRSDWTIDDYIEAAGGRIVHTKFYAAKPIVYYPGGNAEVDNGWLFTPEVTEGSKIVINRIEKEPDQNWVGELRAWLAITTSTVTILILISKF